MRYVVAYVSMFDNELMQVVIEADNPIAALHDGVGKLTTGLSDWLDGLCQPVAIDNLQPVEAYEKWSVQLEQIKDAFFNCDQLVSVIAI